MSDAFPVSEHAFGEPIPDLSRIAPERWLEAMRPLTQAARRAAARTAGPDRVMEAMLVGTELEIEDGGRRLQAAAVLDDPPPLPLPAADAPARSLAGRQVNVRLRHGDHADLEKAAELLGATPTQLARMFIVSGTRRALHDAS